jgi:SagB-type dehydrogenase family enzyme
VPAHVDPTARFRLSRFAFARGDSGGLVIESPLASVRVFLRGQQGGALLASLAEPVSADELQSAVAGSTLDEARTALAVLTAAGVVGAVDDDGTIPAEQAPTMRTWEFHDLLFHTKSRRGRNDLEYGGTYRFREQLPPLPALKPLASNRIISLRRPEQDGAADDSFTHVLEGRRSTREFAAAPLSADQLGELLYQAARVRSVLPADDNRPYEVTRRPYPGAGAAYELELYPLVHRCDGLGPALYHYDPGGHQLELIAGRSDLTDRLLSDAQWSSGTMEPPHVLVVVAARFGRVTWKYGAMAYALVLKDVGVLLQTMCLVATSMGIGACPLGGGDADLFAAVAGTDYYAETSVGELMVGTTS